MSRGDRPALPPGLTFCPPARELTDVYLRCKIVGEDLPYPGGSCIHVADVYSAEPEKLVARFDEAPGTGEEHDQPEVYYFFAPVRYVGGRKTNARGGPGRKSRTIDGEVGKHWHSELGARPVKGGSKFGGYEQTFSYMVRSASTGKDERAGWIMAEYGLSPEHGGGDLVLCKIHRSPRPPSTSETATSSAAVPVSDPTSSKKRKAADGDHLEDPTGSARPRRTYQHDEHLLPVESLEPAAEAPEWYGAAGFVDHQAAPPSNLMQSNMEQEFWSLDQNGAAGFADHQAAPPSNLMQNDTEQDFRSLDQNGEASFAGHQPADQAAQPSNFFQNMNQDIWSLEQICGLVAPPCAAQLENEAAGLVQNIAADAYTNDGDQMEASLRQEPATEKAIYGLPCPAFSTEMIPRCSANVMPWPSSPTSMTMAMLWGL